MFSSVGVIGLVFIFLVPDYTSGLFWCEMLSLENLSCGEVCLISTILKLDGTSLTLLKNTELETQQPCLYLDLLTQYLNPYVHPTYKA